VSYPDLVLAASGPLVVTVSVLTVLRGTSVSSLVLPAPSMMWLLFGSVRRTDAAWHWQLLAHVAALVLLAACCRDKRGLARVAAVGCGAVALWLQVAPIVHS
jgi:hypothetical protein